MNSDSAEGTVKKWYKRDADIYEAEIETLALLQRQYDHPAFKYKVQIDPDGDIEVLMLIPFKPFRSEAWQYWRFQMVYDSDFSIDHNDSIRVYPLDYDEHKVDWRFDHFIYDDKGRRYISEVCLGPNIVGIYRAFVNTLKWLSAYGIWTSGITEI